MIPKIALSCLLGFCVPAFCQEVELVMNHEGNMHVQVGGSFQPMTVAVGFPGGIVVQTNGVFKVGQGKDRKLEAGQTLTADGMLYKPDGSVGPVFDHYVAKGNRIYVVK